MKRVLSSTTNSVNEHKLAIAVLSLELFLVLAEKIPAIASMF